MYCFGYYCTPNGALANHHCAPIKTHGSGSNKSQSKHAEKMKNGSLRSANCTVTHIDNSVQTDGTTVDASRNAIVSAPQPSPYERLVKCLNEDERWQREVTLGRRIGFYRFKGELGNGNFSQVKVALHYLTKEKVAVKILDRSKLDTKTQRMLNREISSMEKLHHPNVVRLFEVIETFSKIYLVMELATGGELFQKITTQGKVDEEEGKLLFAQIVAAVEHMHQHNIIHRDIKAENVFLSESKVVKVGDFGFSLEVSKKDELLNTFCGSPPYAAPELFSDESYKGPYVDLWALGVLLYFMMTSTMPFKAQTVSILKKLILEGDYTIPNYLSFECQSVIKGLLQNDPKDRLTLSQLQKCEWLKDQTFPACLPTYKVALPSITNEADAKEASEESEKIATSSSSPMVSRDESETIRQLQELGIAENMIKENMEKGVRSNVMGTYRIILHRVMSNRYNADGTRRSSSSILRESEQNCNAQESAAREKDSLYGNREKSSYSTTARKSHKSNKSIKSIKSIFSGNQSY
ncbi:serine/threonine-protein kinase NIM1-like protein, partial [Dinothrombium tinctorium]